MEQPFAGTDPNVILVSFCLFMGLLFMIVMFSMQAANKKKVSKNQMCLFVTKNKRLEWNLYPIGDGVIEAPSHHTFDGDRPRQYYTSRTFSLDTWYPPLIPKLFSMIQVPAKVSIYEEGDPAPILPSDAETMNTPARVKSLTSQGIVPKVLNAFDKQLGGGGGSGSFDLGKNKTIVVFGIVVLGAAIIAAAIFSYQSFQGIQILLDWVG